MEKTRLKKKSSRRTRPFFKREAFFLLRNHNNNKNNNNTHMKEGKLLITSLLVVACMVALVALVDDSRVQTQQLFRSAKVSIHKIKQDFVPTGRYGATRVLGQEVPWYEVEASSLDNNNNNNARLIQTIPPAMILGQQGKIMFCPNAKCGTTTLFRTLDDPCRGCKGHASRAFWQDEFGEKDHIMNQRPFAFTHERNPWDRIWSTYKGKIVSGKITIEPFTRDSPPNFVQFLDYVAEHPDANLHWQPFTSRCLISPNKQGHVFHYDHIFRLEDDFEHSLALKLHQVGLKNITMKNTIFNHTEHSLTSRYDFYEAEARRSGITLMELVDKVHQIYRDDIDALGYAFDRYN